MTKIDMIVLQPSRNVSQASDVLWVVPVEAEACWSVEGTVDECCLNQINERSSSLI